MNCLLREPEQDNCKFLIISQDGEALYKAEPICYAGTARPETASVITDLRDLSGQMISG